MLRFPAFMRQMTSPPLIPTSTLFPVAAHAQNDVEALAILEAELEDKLSEIRKGNNNQTVIGKKVVDSKEELEAGAEDDEADNVGDSEGDEFEQETEGTAAVSRNSPCLPRQKYHGDEGRAAHCRG
ncbi:uncharacterized protein LOC141833857 isoform X1 [Curcuma longa]|uniref:uncharacterized protein LOC141833857 isoform X1 n=1 Tax=Curcuma longa TaxID=136217 RepID=UPI003D9F2A27